jgi:2-succinyl-6-hydroxy-2,4-cyclohexadiene-1-carboxylate synthase
MDLPGHGLATDLRLSFEEAAAYLGEAGGPATFVGYSMGGRLCLRMALDRPGVVHSLVLVGASPGIADTGEREARRRSDARLAADLETDGVHDFLDRWLAQPLFETTTPRPEDIAARRRNTPAGLAYALRRLGTGSQEPLWDRLGELRMPVALVVGEHDAKFRAIAERMAAGIGVAARVVVVEGAGHAVPLDRPDEVARIIDHAATAR